MLHGIRGATTAAANTPEAIHTATRALLEELIERNRLRPDEVAACFFSVTRDLDQAFPAGAARSLGWDQVPLLDLQQAHHPGDLPRCIRVLILLKTDGDREFVAVYQGEAARLRPDLQNSHEEDDW